MLVQQTSVTCLLIAQGSLSVPLTQKEPSIYLGIVSENTELDGFPRAVTTCLCHNSQLIAARHAESRDTLSGS